MSLASHPYTTEVSFTRPRIKTAQQGNAYTPSWFRERPLNQKIKEYEHVATKDPITSSTLTILVDTLLSLTDKLTHPDPEINDYLDYNIQRLQDVTGKTHHDYMSEAIMTALWAGFSVTESLMTVENGSLLMEDFLTYHPSTIYIRTNKKGRLTEGEPSFSSSGVKSGVYQASRNLDRNLTMDGELQLSLWKIALLNFKSRYGNYYGESIIEPIYKLYLTGEVIPELMVIGLDRFGTPIITIALQLAQTTQTAIDPATGEEKNLNTQEVFEQQIQAHNIQGGNLLILPYVDPAAKPEVKTLTSGNNIGSTFIDTINFINEQKMVGLMTPFCLVNTSEQRVSASVERQMEVFYRVVTRLHKTFIPRFIAQTWHRLIKFSYNRASAQTPPTMPLLQTVRPEDRTSMMQLVSGLTERGYFNPSNEKDWSMVRSWVSADGRQLDPKDVEFINNLLIYPRTGTPEIRALQKEELKQAKANKDNSSQVALELDKENAKPAAAGKSAKNLPGTSDPNRDRSREGKIKGTGRGRPSGTSSPQSTPR
jgi:hypothetical protein